MKRNRSEAERGGSGIFDAYDPVVESMILEWEVDRQCLSRESLLPGVERMRTSEHSVVAEEGARDYAARMAVERVETGQDEGEKIVKGGGVKRSSAVRARTLRRKFTDAELKLWRHLRGRQIGGKKFRRQQPLGKYVVDFVCFEQKLIVEVDGGQHAAPNYDKERTLWLESEGFRVIRFWNNEVLRDIGIVLDAIYKELKSDEMNHPHPTPLPSRERVKDSAVKVRMGD